MSERKEVRFTIAQFLIFTVGFGLFLAVLLNRALFPVIGQGLALIVLLGVTAMAFTGITEGFLGRSCPSCASGRMQRVRVTTFGYRFFRCPACRARWKRGPMGGWEQAETDEDAPRFARKEVEDPWTLPPSMTDDSEMVWSKTHTTLLHNKQKRNPNAPRQEKPPPIE